MGLAILFVVLLLYILLAYFAARTWPVWHVVLLVFLFIFSFVFVFLASATLKVQQRWRSQYTAAMRDIETEQENQRRLTMGSLGGDELGEIQLRGDVKRMLVDRGRVWRNLRPKVGEGQVLLDASRWDESGCRSAGAADETTADGDTDEASDVTDEAAAGTPTDGQPSVGLEADAVVFAFKETELRNLPEPVRQILASGGENADEATDNQDGLSCKVPTYYMGEYRVVADPNAGPTAIVLVPTMPLSESQIAQLQDLGDPTATWVLYEVMPTDAHEVFSGLTSQQLSQLIPKGGMPDDRYQQLTDTYARDLQPARAEDPPERKWMTIKFTSLPEPETIDVDVDVAAESGEQPLPDSVFDPIGRSLVATLNQGEKTEFREGDEATFDFATAQELINQGKAELVQPIYYRQLRDYARAFRGLTADLAELARQLELAQVDLDKGKKSIDELQTQLAFQTQQRERLAADLEGLNTERTVLGQFVSGLERKWGELRAELSRTYRANRQLVNRMAASP